MLELCGRFTVDVAVARSPGACVQLRRRPTATFHSGVTQHPGLQTSANKDGRCHQNAMNIDPQFGPGNRGHRSPPPGQGTEAARSPSQRGKYGDAEIPALGGD